MYTTSLLRIDLKALDGGESTSVCELEDSYFQAIDASDVRRGKLKLTMTVKRVNSFFNLLFHVEGVVYIPCDLCLEDMEQPVFADGEMTVKLGEACSEEDDVVTVAEEDGILDVAWHVYEMIVLNIPIKHEHASGKCDSSMIEKLQELSAVRRSEKEETGIDPRWAKLQALQTED